MSAILPNFSQQARASIRTLTPYKPGKPIDELKRELGLDTVIKLASNENPLGPSQKVKAAISDAMCDLTLYPDGAGFSLKQALAKKYVVSPDMLTLGNGSNDILDIVGRVFAGEGDEIIYSAHAFAVYPITAQLVGATGIETPAKDWGHDLDAMLNAISAKTKLIFIANPNNPTGTFIEGPQLKAFLTRVPAHVMVVLDEAYTEYLSREESYHSFAWIAEHPNLIVTRTFSKAFGLAALRVGFAVAHPQVTDLLNRVRQPFNVNSLALVAAEVALKDDDYLQASAQLNATERSQMTQSLQAMGLTVIPSKGNFVAVNVGQPTQTVFQALLRKGVIIRPIENYAMPNFIRVSIALPEENAQFIRALSDVLKELGA
jgi:histidinol-phosphate aminotransferase